MEDNPISLFQNVARNYLLYLADFPPDLKPEHLTVPRDQQQLVFHGLHSLFQCISQVYSSFANRSPAAQEKTDLNTCAQVIEAPIRTLWALGACAVIKPLPAGCELIARRFVLDEALKQIGVKDPRSALSALDNAGVMVEYRAEDGQPIHGGYKKCSALTLHYPPDNEGFLRALSYYANHLPANKANRRGVIIELFLRADFRPLLPGYAVHIPHLPTTEEEVTRTFRPENLAIWREIKTYMDTRHPQYQLYFRLPRIAGRGWVADFSTKDNDYGKWSIYIEEKGMVARVVLNRAALLELLDHIDEFSNEFQETYLTTVACKDCVHCGQEVHYQHGDHMHRLCKSPWFFSPYIQQENLADITRLVEYRLEMEG